MRHHRKLLRRLRALFPREQRRGVVIERTRGGCWRVITGQVVVGTRRGRSFVVDGGCVLAWENRRVDALKDALRKRARETKGDTQ